MKRCNTSSCGKSRMWRKTAKFDPDGSRIWQCKNCGNFQAEERPINPKYPPRILYFDLETSQIEIKKKVWGMKQYGKYESWKNITKDQFIICWAGAWVDENKRVKVIGDSVTSKEALARDDGRIVTKLRNQMDLADWVTGHNMRSFDWKTTNARILINDIPAPLEPKIADTLSISRRKFRVASHSLEYWSGKLGGKPKDKMVLDDWNAIEDKGSVLKLNKMFRYCKGDIREGVNVFKNFQKYVEASTGKPLCR